MSRTRAFARVVFAPLALSALAALFACGTTSSAIHENARDRSTVRYVRSDAAFDAIDSLAPHRQDPFVPAADIHAHKPPKKHIQPTPMIQQASVEEWNTRYPDAARELGAWVKTYPKVAGFFFEWDASNPDGVEVLAEWAIAHRFESIGSFMFNRHGWTTLEVLLQQDYKPAIEEFLEWCRRSPRAATELVKHTNGLAWAGQHLYQRELATAAR